jgi:hypothetical protein
MLFEVLSSAVVGGFVGYTYLSQSGSTNDGKKIARICANSGLTVREGGKTLTMQLLRRNRREWGVEYAYRIPLGLSFHDFEKRLDHIRDGLNRQNDLASLLQALKELRLNRNIVKDIKRLLSQKKGAKEIELSYDGLLIVKVYDQPMTDRFVYDRGLLNKVSGWQIPVGTTRTSLIKHDFEKHCHITIAGMTDYGKSVFLKNIITTLIAKQTRNVKFYLVDLKGGLAFNRFRNLEQVQGVAKNPEEAFEMLSLAQEKMNERINFLLEKGYEDIKEAGILERIFVVIDEAADISDHKACQEIIKDIARRGRGAGFRLIYATQYPTNETISPQVRQNCSSRLCFRLSTATASRAVIDEDGAEKLPLIKGRALYKTDRTVICQTPLIENSFIDDTIKPNITFRARKESDEHAASVKRKASEGTASRKHTLVIEETRLS